MERAYNALRLARALAKKYQRRKFTLLLMADAVSAAEGGQKMPEGFLQRRAHVEAGARQDPCPAMRHPASSPGA
jgi:sulfur relay (sulfurtransferase) complex TusBCD TusD component (DsrE family)